MTREIEWQRKMFGNRAPLVITYTPNIKWKKIHIDLKGPLSKGVYSEQYILVVKCACTHFIRYDIIIYNIFKCIIFK